MTKAGLDRLHAVAERHVGAERVPGLVARGDQVHVEALGSLSPYVLPIGELTRPVESKGRLRHRSICCQGLPWL